MAKRIQADQFEVMTLPTTSASTYDILTRNTSTGVVEKVASGGFIPYSGASDSVNLGLFDLTADTLMSSSIISSDFYVNNKIDINGSNPTLSILDGVSYVHKVNTTTFFGGTNYFSIVKIYPSFDEKQLRFDFSNITNNETSILTIPDKDGTIALTSDLFGKRITNATTTGSYAVDWNVGDVWDLTLTGATTITDTNLPSGTNTKVIEFLVTGAFAITFPAYWTPLPSSQTYDGAKVNHIVVSCIVGTGGSEKIFYSNEPTT